PWGPSSGAAALWRPLKPRDVFSGEVDCAYKGLIHKKTNDTRHRKGNSRRKRAPPEDLFRTKTLFVANGFHRIEPRGFHGRVRAKDQAHGDGNQKGQEDGADGNDGGPSRHPGDQLGHRKARDDAQEAAGKGNQHGFDDKLTHDVRAPRADGAANADFAGTLEDGGQHDVHDADSADKQGNRSDGYHDGVEKLLSAPLLGQKLGGNDDAEVPGIVMRGIEDAANHF